MQEMQIFRDNLNRLFTESGWTMAELSRRAKISRAQLIMVMRNESTLSGERLEQVARAFGLSLKDMLSETVPDQETVEEERLAMLYRHSPAQAKAAVMALLELSAGESPDTPES